MLSVSKECCFDAAHVLTDHAGQCRNLHGHTYRLIVEVGDTTGKLDMVVDFKDLKTIIHQRVIEVFDHAFIYNTANASESRIAAVLVEEGMKVVGVPFRSTAENLAKHFYALLADQVPVIAIKLYETPQSCAQYAPSRER